MSAITKKLDDLDLWIINNVDDSSRYFIYINQLLSIMGMAYLTGIIRSKLAKAVLRATAPHLIRQYNGLKARRNKYVHENKTTGNLENSVQNFERQLRKVRLDKKRFKEQFNPQLYVLYTFSPKMLYNIQHQTTISLIKLSLYEKTTAEIIEELMESRYPCPQDTPETFFRGHLTTDYVLWELIGQNNRLDMLKPLKPHLENTITSLLNLEAIQNSDQVYESCETFDKQQRERARLWLKQFDMVLLVPLGKTRAETRRQSREEIATQFSQNDSIFFGVLI